MIEQNKGIVRLRDYRISRKIDRSTYRQRIDRNTLRKAANVCYNNIYVVCYEIYINRFTYRQRIDRSTYRQRIDRSTYRQRIDRSTYRQRIDRSTYRQRIYRNTLWKAANVCYNNIYVVLWNITFIYFQTTDVRVLPTCRGNKETMTER